MNRTDYLLLMTDRLIQEHNHHHPLPLLFFWPAVELYGDVPTRSPNVCVHRGSADAEPGFPQKSRPLVRGAGGAAEVLGAEVQCRSGSAGRGRANRYTIENQQNFLKTKTDTNNLHRK